MYMTKDQQKPLFSELGIEANFLASLSKKGFVNPTPIQHQVIPALLEGKDVIGIAQTGTGKTLAFGIPMIQNLMKVKGIGLVVVPTRELALQVDEELLKVGKPLGLKTAVLIGGTSARAQVNKLRQNPKIVIATPGRLIDHLDQRTFSLKNIAMIALDEADRMLDIGFMPQIKRIMSDAPEDKQSLLFSATMPKQIAELANKFMKFPLRIEVARAGTTSENVEQEIFVAQKNQKMQLLEKILGDNDGTVIVFSRTKHGAKRIARNIRNIGHTAVEIHSNRSLAQRKAAMQGFKSGRYRVLVATDIAARGIDVSNITLVINYDLPDNSEDYVHRIGRTGRAGKTGKAISFATTDQGWDIKKIEKLIKKKLPRRKLPKDLPAPRAQARDDRDDRGSRGGYNRGGRSGGYRGRGRGGDSRRRNDRPKRGGRNASRREVSGNFGKEKSSKKSSFDKRKTSSKKSDFRSEGGKKRKYGSRKQTGRRSASAPKRGRSAGKRSAGYKGKSFARKR